MTPDQIIDLLPDAAAQALRGLLRVSDGHVDPVLNEIVFMAVTLAIAAEVEPEIFADNVKASWKHIADQVNAATLETAKPEGNA